MADWFKSVWAEASVADGTVHQYAAGLRYWDAWHRCRYGSPLPLQLRPPIAVSKGVLEAFISDHAAVAEDGRLQMKMPTDIRQGLREAGLIRAGVVAPRTTIWRLLVLRQAHIQLRQPFDAEFIGSRQAEMIAAHEAEKAAVGNPTFVPMSAANVVSAMVAACGDDRQGILDAALVHLVCRLKPAQVCALRFGDLTPGHLKTDPRVDIVEVNLRGCVPGPLSFESRLHFIGAEATIIKDWGAIREDEVSGNEWFFAREASDGDFRPLDAHYIARRLRILAQRAGLAGATAYRACSAIGLRKAHEREHHESLPITKVARAAGVSLHSAKLLARGVRADNP